MKRRKIIPSFALALVFCVTAAQARQQQPPQQPQQPQDNNPPLAPLPPAASDQTGGGENREMPAAAGRSVSGGDTQSDSATAEPDTHALAGAEAIGLGTRSGSHDVFDPALHVTVGFDTGTVPGQLTTSLSPGGSLLLDHSWGRYDLIAQYSGAETIYALRPAYHAAFHNLALAQVIQGQRITIRLRDNFIESPGSSFGGLNTGGAGLFTPNLLTGLAPSFSPSQSIFTGNANQISNSAVGELDYALTRRSTLTFVGSYGLLHFLGSGYIDNSNEDGRLGYSHVLDRKSSIGLTYDYNNTNFVGTKTSMISQAIQGTYGRRLTGRMAFQLSGGPQFYSQVGALSPWQLTWTVFSTLTYQVRHTTYGISYYHGVTNGAGVFQGSQSHTITGSAQTTFRRYWTSVVSSGYSYTADLSLTGGGATHFGSWYATAAAGRLWAGILQTNVSYGVQRQTTDAVCPVLSCGPTTFYQVFGVTLTAHLSPIRLE